MNKITDDEFKEALSRFDGIIAQQLMGEGESAFPKNWLKSPVDTSIDYEKRLEMYLEELKGWVLLKSQELDEFEGEDLTRLRGEAIGCMYAIRELMRHFSELSST